MSPEATAVASAPGFRSGHCHPRRPPLSLPPPAVTGFAAALGGGRCCGHPQRLPLPPPLTAAAAVAAATGGCRHRHLHRRSPLVLPTLTAAAVSTAPNGRPCCRRSRLLSLSLPPRLRQESTVVQACGGATRHRALPCGRERRQCGVCTDTRGTRASGSGERDAGKAPVGSKKV